MRIPRLETARLIFNDIERLWRDCCRGLAMPGARQHLRIFLDENLDMDEERMSPDVAVEAIWCNMRDDGPHEYFAGTILAHIPLNELSGLFDQAARELRKESRPC